MGLRSAVSKLNAAIEDLSSLHVQTFTGVVGTEFTSKDGFDKVRAAVKKAKTDGKVTLVAEAYYQFDGDSYNFLTKDADVPAGALDLHESAVQAGMKTRQGLMELVRDVFKG